MVVGLGAVGARASRQLLDLPGLDELLLVGRGENRADAVARSLGAPARRVSWDPDLLAPGDVVVLASPDDQRRRAEATLERGAHLVSTSDALDDVRGLLDLDAEARERSLSVVVGAGFSPGLACVLARHAATEFEVVEEVHVAKVGTGGPACARHHHRMLGREALDWREGAWVHHRGGSGRELCWFPDPICSQDCYRAGLPEPLLLAPAFPGARRITAKVAATRRDRVTARLPMLRPPHPDAGLGGLRVDVRGRRGSVHDGRVLGAVDGPASASGAVAAVAARFAVTGELARYGAGGLAELVPEPLPFLRDLGHRGVRAAVFVGTS